jgi:hypothetical protein
LDFRIVLLQWLEGKFWTFRLEKNGISWYLLYHLILWSQAKQLCQLSLGKVMAIRDSTLGEVSKGSCIIPGFSYTHYCIYYLKN